MHAVVGDVVVVDAVVGAAVEAVEDVEAGVEAVAAVVATEVSIYTGRSYYDILMDVCVHVLLLTYGAVVLPSRLSSPVAQTPINI